MKILANAVVAGGMIAAAVVLKKLVRSRKATPTDETGFGHFAGHAGPGYHALAELDVDLRAIERDEAAHQGSEELRRYLSRTTPS